MKTKELSYLTTLAGSLTVLGIIFSSDQVIDYSFIRAGMLLSIISMIKLRRNEQRSSLETNAGVLISSKGDINGK